MVDKDTAVKKNKKFLKDKKGSGPEITDPVKVEFEPNIGHLYAGMDEAFEAIASGKDTTLLEIMSVASRIKRKQQIRRYRARMQIARKRSLRRRASSAVISRRARRGAVSSVKKRLSGGRASNKLTYSERMRVEKLAARRKGLISRRARRLLIVKRQQDRNRINNRSKRK